MTATVLITTPNFGRDTTEPWDVLRRGGCDTRTTPYLHPLTAVQLREQVAGADALITGLDPVTAEVLDAAPHLKVVAKHGVGVDNIDLRAAAARGIRVVNAPGANTTSVAELAFGLLLATARRIVDAHACVTGGGWEVFTGPELAGKVLAVVGFGRIGSAVARRALAFDLQVIAHDPYVDAATITAAGVTPVSLQECLARADFLTLHLPATAGGGPLLGRAELATVKRGACIVNTARGGLLDEAALSDLLRQGHLAAAGIDAFSTEPPHGNPLLTAPNVVLTPHIGARTPEATRTVGVTIAHDILRVLDGQEPLHPVR